MKHNELYTIVTENVLKMAENAAKIISVPPFCDFESVLPSYRQFKAVCTDDQGQIFLICNIIGEKDSFSVPLSALTDKELELLHYTLTNPVPDYTKVDISSLVVVGQDVPATRFERSVLIFLRDLAETDRLPLTAEKCKLLILTRFLDTLKSSSGSQAEILSTVDSLWRLWELNKGAASFGLIRR